jgi:hypothetical protein
VFCLLGTPYDHLQAWADEHMEGTEDSADSIKDGVYWAQDLAARVRFWCFVSLGLMAAVLAGVYWGEWRGGGAGAGSGEEEEEKEERSHYHLLG